MKKVAIIGSGNWGTAVAKLIASNITASDAFDHKVLLWIHEEMYQHQKLSEYINAFRINPIYLPGVKLPENVRAVTDFGIVSEADILVICLPCRFMDVIKEIHPKPGAFAVNLSKGFILQEKRLLMPSEYIKSVLNIECATLMGANIAVEVAMEKLAEATVGYTKKDQISYLEWMFDCRYFRPKMVQYNKGIEICGGLKNIVSLGFGICEGMEWGSNTKAILFRKGVQEIGKLAIAIGASFPLQESCCIGDLIASCLSGRNYKCGIEMAKNRCKSVEVERRLGGQKIEGPEAASTVVQWCEENGTDIGKYPVIQAIHRICFLGEAPEYLYSVLKKCNE